MSNINFNNTETAFKYKSNPDLKQAYQLFKLLSYPTLVNTGAVLTPLLINCGGKALIKKTIYKQFVGGENRNECIKTMDLLAQYNVGSILDYSVEGKKSEEDFENCKKEIIENIHFSKNHKHIPFCVFKPTGLAPLYLLEKVSAGTLLNTNESKAWDNVKKRVFDICQTAYDNKQPIFVDAEESWLQKAIDDMVDECMATFNKNECIVLNTFQLYRHDRLQFMKDSFDKAKKNGYYFGAKLVRGAYMEKERERAQKNGYPSPIYNTKPETDKGYNDALTFCVENIDRVTVCAGTHNENSSQHLVELIEKHKLPKADNRIYFSQLLGMSDHISFNLAKEGYNVVKYVPYGPVKNVLPYLIRRAQENTSVQGQTGRELSLILTERKRRAK